MFICTMYIVHMYNVHMYNVQFILYIPKKVIIYEKYSYINSNTKKICSLVMFKIKNCFIFIIFIFFFVL